MLHAPKSIESCLVGVLEVAFPLSRLFTLISMGNYFSLCMELLGT